MSEDKLEIVEPKEIKNESLASNLKKKFSKDDDEIVYDVNGEEIGILKDGKLSIGGKNFKSEIIFEE